MPSVITFPATVASVHSQLSSQSRVSSQSQMHTANEDIKSQSSPARPARRITPQQRNNIVQTPGISNRHTTSVSTAHNEQEDYVPPTSLSQPIQRIETELNQIETELNQTHFSPTAP